MTSRHYHVLSVLIYYPSYDWNNSKEGGGGVKTIDFQGFWIPLSPCIMGGWFEIEWYLILLITENLVLKPYGWGVVVVLVVEGWVAGGTILEIDSIVCN